MCGLNRESNFHENDPFWAATFNSFQVDCDHYRTLQAPILDTTNKRIQNTKKGVKIKNADNF